MPFAFTESNWPDFQTAINMTLDEPIDIPFEAANAVGQALAHEIFLRDNAVAAWGSVDYVRSLIDIGDPRRAELVDAANSMADAFPDELEPVS